MINGYSHGANEVSYQDEKVNRLMMTGDVAKMDVSRAVHV